LLGRAADEAARIHHVSEIDFCKGGIIAQALEEIIGAALHLHLLGGGEGVAANAFVEFLAIAALLDAGHEDFFGGHEGEFGHDESFDDLRIDDQAAGDVDDDLEAAIDGEEGFGDAEALVGGIIERALEPLLGGGLKRRTGERDDEARQAGGALAAHGVAFVGHGAGADLLGFERFFHLLHAGEEADIVGEAVHAGGCASESADDGCIDFARVGLAGDGEGFSEAEALGD